MYYNMLTKNLDFKNLNFSSLMINHYRSINIQANKVMSKYRRVPLQKDDLVNVALFELPNLLQTFDSKYDVSINAFVALKSYYYMLNYARSFTNKNEQIMNDYIEFDLVENISEVIDHEEPTNSHQVCNLDSLTKMERIAFKMFFLDKYSLKESANKMQTNAKAVSNAICRIRSKLRKLN